MGINGKQDQTRNIIFQQQQKQKKRGGKEEKTGVNIKKQEKLKKYKKYRNKIWMKYWKML